MLARHHGKRVKGGGILDADALARALGKTEEILIQAFALGRQPAFGLEGPRRGEEGLVVVDLEGAHADGGAGGDVVRFLQRGGAGVEVRGMVCERIGRDAGEARADAVGEPEGFVDHGRV